ncbi:MAG: hypothetical protein ABW098_07460 [Candidatus Thiodiazotropha sp.]
MALLKLQLSIVLVFTTIASCGFVGCSLESKSNIKRDPDFVLTWPPAPSEPRIKYIGVLSHPKDLGISKGFLTMLSEFAIGKEDNGMVLPMAVVENNQNQLFVADPGINAIHMFDRDRGMYKIIKRKDGKDFDSPVGLAADKNGNVYIADSVLGLVFVIGVNDDEAEQVDFEANFNRPTSIAVDSENGWIYIVDTGLHKISIFNSNKTLLKNFGSRGVGKGQFNFPTHIWKNKNGEILVTDSLNFRIQRFDRHGNYIEEFGKPGNAIGSFSRPKGVAEDRYGHVYVVDSLFHNVQLFDTTGYQLMDFGNQGSKLGQFWLPVGIFITEDDTIYLCDSYNQRVQVFKYIGTEQ